MTVVFTFRKYDAAFEAPNGFVYVQSRRSASTDIIRREYDSVSYGYAELFVASDRSIRYKESETVAGRK